MQLAKRKEGGVRHGLDRASMNDDDDDDDQTQKADPPGDPSNRNRSDHAIASTRCTGCTVHFPSRSAIRRWRSVVELYVRTSRRREADARLG